jgi:hypothetical protein
MEYVDMYGEPIEDKGMYVTPSGDVVIFYEEGEDFIAKSTPLYVTVKLDDLEFTKTLTRIDDPCSAARFILSELEGITVDEESNDLPF